MQDAGRSGTRGAVSDGRVERQGSTYIASDRQVQVLGLQ